MRQQEHDAGFLTLSNMLSLARIPLGVAFLATPDAGWMAVIIFAAAATDALDGFIARVSGTRSHIGLILDPLCDKMFVLCALTAFLARGELSAAGFMILVLRDLYAGGSYLAGRMVGLVIPFRPRWPGKLATALQLLALLALIFGPRYVPLLVLLVGLVSVVSIIDYGDRALRRDWGEQTA